MLYHLTNASSCTLAFLGGFSLLPVISLLVWPEGTRIGSYPRILLPTVTNTLRSYNFSYRLDRDGQRQSGFFAIFSLEHTSKITTSRREWGLRGLKISAALSLKSRLVCIPQGHGEGYTSVWSTLSPAPTPARPKFHEQV
jgi:hypothetical protein